MRHLLERDLNHILEHTGGVWDSLRGQRIFITGGTGFVGTWLLESFAWANDRLELGSTAVVLTRNRESFSRRAPHLACHEALQFLEGDAHSFPHPAGDFPFIIHAATEKAVPATADLPLGAYFRDLQTTLYVLEFAKAQGTKRFLFTSSGAVYGKQPSDMEHIREEYVGAPATTDSNSTYGQAKHGSEFMCTMYARQFGFAGVIARLFAFSGPYLPLDLNFAVGNFVGDVLSGRPVHIGGDGTPYRSYLYAADLAIWLWTLLVRGESSRPYNVGSGEAVSISELARAVVRATRPQTEIRIASQSVQGAPAARYVPSVERAREELGLVPLISLEDGIRRMYEWHVARNESKRSSTSDITPVVC
jgi:dTDP-glucose 4,6-dehydratase